MGSVAIISEYNPFHNGHARQLELIHSHCPDAVTVSIMSPNFVQRGDGAVFDKYSRARAANACGVDLCLSLPFVFANLSAEGFAEAGVKIANAVGVDILCFGAECESQSLLTEIADYMLSEEFTEHTAQICRDNPSLSLMRAAEPSIAERLGESAVKAFREPNNILAIEYIKAIRKFNFPITPLAVVRNGAGYKSLSHSPLPSALYVRERLSKKEDISSLVPSPAFEIYSSLIDEGNYFDYEAFYRFLHSSIYMKSIDELERCTGSFELASRISNGVKNFSSLDQSLNSMTTTRFTRSRIKRALICALFGISHNEFMHKDPEFSQLLAVSEKGRRVLASLRGNNLPIIVKNADASKYTADSNFRRQFELELLADGVWAQFQKTPAAPNSFIKTSPFVKGQ